MSLKRVGAEHLNEHAVEDLPSGPASGRAGKPGYHPVPDAADGDSSGLPGLLPVPVPFAGDIDRTAVARL